MAPDLTLLQQISQLPDDAWLLTREVAAYLRVPTKTVYAWHAEGKGPKAHHLGRLVRYRMGDVRAWAQGAPAPETQAPRRVHDLMERLTQRQERR